MQRNESNSTHRIGRKIVPRRCRCASIAICVAGDRNARFRAGLGRRARADYSDTGACRSASLQNEIGGSGTRHCAGHGGGSGGPAVPEGGGGRRANRNHAGQWGWNWARLYWPPDHFYGFWSRPEAWGGPNTVWGGPYVPYRNYGDWGALWYPYAEWRGPHGGWGNP